MARKGIQWLDDVERHDFDAAERYLSIKLEPDQAKVLIRRLLAASVTLRRANDLLRACDREPLPFDDPGVERDLAKVVDREKLSPILVVSLGDGTADIADGFHRLSLAYRLDPFSEVPLRLAGI